MKVAYVKVGSVSPREVDATEMVPTPAMVTAGSRVGTLTVCLLHFYTFRTTLGRVGGAVGGIELTSSALGVCFDA